MILHDGIYPNSFLEVALLFLVGWKSTYVNLLYMDDHDCILIIIKYLKNDEFWRRSATPSIQLSPTHWLPFLSVLRHLNIKTIFSNFSLAWVFFITIILDDFFWHEMSKFLLHKLNWKDVFLFNIMHDHVITSVRNLRWS